MAQANLLGHPPRIKYIWSQQLQDAADALPSNLGRSSMVHGLIQHLELLSYPDSPSNVDTVANGAGTNPVAAHSQAQVIEPDPDLDPEYWMRRYHDIPYVDYLLETAARDSSESESDNSSSSTSSPYRRVKRRRTEQYGLEHDCPWFPELAKYSKLVASSTLTACRLLANQSAEITINWDGGRHHAMRNKASGFCYVADVVLGIMLLTKEGKGRNGKKPRVLYLDLDLHYGDGVAQAFLSPTRYLPEYDSGKRSPRPAQVLTLSVHHHSAVFFPPHTPHSGLPSDDTPNPFTLSIPLSAYPSCGTYKRIWESVESVQKAYDPDYVVLQLGVDGLPGDRVGQYGAWGIDDPGGLRWCINQVKAWDKPLCILGGGGYDHPNTARAWAVATGELLGQSLPSDSTIPDHQFFPEYAPSFTLEVPSSHIRDENTEEALEEINEVFARISARIERIVKDHA